MTKITPITKPASPYISLEELAQLRPHEDDVVFEDNTFKVRGLTAGQVTTIIAMSRDASWPTGENLEISRTLTVAFGLVEPDLKAAEDLEAARLLVGGMPALLRAALRETISALTWQGAGMPAATDEAAAEREREGAEEPVAVSEG